jgi:hypothetical protein
MQRHIRLWHFIVFRRMNTFECPRCGYDSSNIHYFRKHLSRKTICDPIVADVSLEDTKKQHMPAILGFDCDYCERKFSNKQAKSKHMNKCASRPSSSNERIKELEALVAEKEDEIKRIKETIAPTIVQNVSIAPTIVQNVAQQNIIVINPLGVENKSNITPEFMLECVKKKIDGLIDLIQKKHFDPSKPENHNIKIEGENYTFLENPFLCPSNDVIKIDEYNDLVWVTMKKMHALQDRIMPRVETEFKDFFRDHSKKIQKKYIDEFVKDIVLPMEWTMDLDEEEEFDISEDDAHEIRCRIYGMIKKCIDENYSKLVT